MAGLRNYQYTPLLNNLYEIRLAVSSGLGETLEPRITSIGGLITMYGSEDLPTGLTLANVATKMALIKDDVAIESFKSIPNYLVIVQKSGTTTELTLTGINPDVSLAVLA